jgi:hypothetical protein
MFMSLPIVGVIAGISGILYLYGASDEGSYGPLAVFLLVAAVAYVISLFVHPRRPCWKCRGGGKHRGIIWDYGDRRCENCGGSGKRPRWGTKFFSGIDAS